MHYLDETCESPEENLALDEILLEQAEQGSMGDCLRFWEARSVFVVIGYSNKYENEARMNDQGAPIVPIYRRRSGGGAVVQGPGCLSYSLVISSLDGRPLPGLTEANCKIMTRQADALVKVTGADVRVRGITDLAIGERKFSGNASRRRRRAMLFHGTFLLDFDFSVIEKVLPFPERRPEYRKDRRHSDFLMNLAVPPSRVKTALQEAWLATDAPPEIPWDQVKNLANTHYASDEWTRRF